MEGVSYWIVKRGQDVYNCVGIRAARFCQIHQRIQRLDSVNGMWASHFEERWRVGPDQPEVLEQSLPVRIEDALSPAVLGTVISFTRLIHF